MLNSYFYFFLTIFQLFKQIIQSQLIKYHPQSGQWTLRVKHFTRYGGIIEEEDSVPGDEQNEQSEEESIHSNKSKPTQNNRMVIENHAPYYTDFSK